MCPTDEGGGGPLRHSRVEIVEGMITILSQHYRYASLLPLGGRRTAHAPSVQPREAHSPSSASSVMRKACSNVSAHDEIGRVKVDLSGLQMPAWLELSQ